MYKYSNTPSIIVVMLFSMDTGWGVYNILREERLVVRPHILLLEINNNILKYFGILVIIWGADMNFCIIFAY